MHYTIYQITNKLDGKIYIGKHQTKALADDYMGSGKHLTRAQKKHGLENFEKQILFIFDTEEEMNLKEAELVSEEFCAREDTYNICPGGKGGWGYNNSIKTPEDRSKLGQLGLEHLRKNPDKIKIGASNGGKATKMKIQSGEIDTSIYTSRSFLGLTHSDITKRKISERTKSQVRIECPHCKKLGISSNMKRWHFDNCKFLRV